MVGEMCPNPASAMNPRLRVEASLTLTGRAQKGAFWTSKLHKRLHTCLTFENLQVDPKGKA